MPADRRVVQARLAKIEECAVRLREIAKARGRRPFPDRHVQAEAERLLQVATQSLLDLGAHLISASGFREPADYAEVIDILGEEGVLPKRFAKSIRGMAGLRNLLVHDYLAVDPVRLREFLRKVSDFETFCRHVARFLGE